MDASKRANRPVTYALMLGDDEATVLNSVAGGDVRGVVQDTPGGPRHYSKKHIAYLHYEPFAIEIGMAMSNGLAGWINTSWKGRPAKVNGAIAACDFSLHILSRRAFTNAHINEISFPAMDAGSNDSGFLTVRFVPEAIQYKKGEGRLNAANLNKQKLWRTANFRLEIDGLEDASKRITRIDGFSIKQEIRSAKFRKVRYPNLKVSFDAAHSQDWQAWFEDFVIRGHHGDDQERYGALVFLSSDKKTELGRIDLHHLGIFALSPDGSGDADRLTAELYCESMDLKLGENSS